VDFTTPEATESFRNPQDVLEYFIKHKDKTIKVGYKENLKSYDITLK